MLTFYTYCLRTYKGLCCPGADILRDMRRDPDFPRRASSRGTILGYLNHRGTGPDRIKAFEDALAEYEQHVQSGAPDPIDYTGAWRGYARFYHGPKLVSNSGAEGKDVLCMLWEDCAEGAPLGPDPNSLASWHDLGKDEKQALIEYVWYGFKPTKNTAYNRGPYNQEHTSRSLKRRYEALQSYVTNGQFKAAMLLCGYAPEDPSALNWRFRIDPASPALALPADEGLSLTRRAALADKFSETPASDHVRWLWDAMIEYTFK